MGNETTITIRGHAGTVPMIREADSGGRWTRFRMGSTSTFRKADGTWVDADPLWFTVKVNGPLAERACSLVRKGTPLIVRGTLRDDSWVDDNGQERHSPSIRADSIGVDIAGRGVVVYKPPQREREEPATPPEGFQALGPGPAGEIPQGGSEGSQASDPSAGAFGGREQVEQPETVEDDGRPF